MSRMVRKQLYIEKRQDDMLKRRAKAQGVTEAELVREALDAPVLPASRAFHPDEDAWDSFLRFVRRLAHRGSRRARRAVPSSDRGWTRDDLYEERIGRWVRS
ncbi:MAG: hypothetical protein GEU99_05540 [Luteitalea sp.]|nr:hypothetical protein [Luteitalea sp.]